MARKSAKQKPMRSRKSGLKKKKLIEQNIKVIKNLEKWLFG